MPTAIHECFYEPQRIFCCQRGEAIVDKAITLSAITSEVVAAAEAEAITTYAITSEVVAAAEAEAMTTYALHPQRGRRRGRGRGHRRRDAHEQLRAGRRQAASAHPRWRARGPLFLLTNVVGVADDIPRPRVPLCQQSIFNLDEGA